ncbi:hypothetical protein CX676_19795 (plasmid) [Paracoccus zhejiangensis]|uniref:Uncharacterized protein n=1 Tax=Paracoccus zhejiangensis TaxID=1077935 RepID=A0A2H5F4T6_9RHOB|nr:hypothetical protein CX676_19795 [Paracoccus zhejiangensis]
MLVIEGEGSGQGGAVVIFPAGKVINGGRGLFWRGFVHVAEGHPITSDKARLLDIARLRELRRLSSKYLATTAVIG